MNDYEYYILRDKFRKDLDISKFSDEFRHRYYEEEGKTRVWIEHDSREPDKNGYYDLGVQFPKKGYWEYR